MRRETKIVWLYRLSDSLFFIADVLALPSKPANYLGRIFKDRAMAVQDATKHTDSVL